MTKNRLLIIDDEVHILELLRYNLESSGYEVVQAESGEEALEKLKKVKVDGVILDLMLPGIDGIEVLRQIRQSDHMHLPVIMLTAKNEEIDAVIGLEMGADDYIGKPFRTRELISRVKSVLRRAQLREESYKNHEEVVEKGLYVNTQSHQIFNDGVEVFLTLKEFELLEKLLKSPGRVFTRDELLESIWGYDYVGETRTVDVHIRQLRKKVEQDDKNPEKILTVRGIGYKYKS